MNPREFIYTTYGKEKQVNKTIEELEELTIELLRMQDKKGNKQHLKEEMADVLNMLYQLCLVYKIRITEIKHIAELKVKRTIKRIEKEQKELSQRSQHHRYESEGE